MSIKNNEENKNLEEQILKVAEETFLDKGYAMTSMAEIAKRAGCNQALIHYYFRTKERLFVLLFEKKFATLISTVFTQSDKHPLFKDRLRAVVLGHIAAIAEHPKLPFLIINEMTLNAEKYHPAAEMLKIKVSGLLEDMDKELHEEYLKGTIREIKAVDLLLLILSLNVFVFLAQPIYSQIKGLDYDEYMEFAQGRGEVNFETIWKSISC